MLHSPLPAQPQPLAVLPLSLPLLSDADADGKSSTGGSGGHSSHAQQQRKIKRYASVTDGATTPCEKSSASAAACTSPAAAASASAAPSVSAVRVVRPVSAAISAARTHTIRMHSSQTMQAQHSIITMTTTTATALNDPLPPPPQESSPPPPLPLPVPSSSSSRLRSPIHHNAGARPLSAAAALGATVPVAPSPSRCMLAPMLLTQDADDDDAAPADDAEQQDHADDAADNFDAVAVSSSSLQQRYPLHPSSSTISRAHAEAQAASIAAAAQAALEAAILRAAGLPSEAEEDYSLGVDTVVAPLHSPCSAAATAAGVSPASAVTADIVPDDYASDEGRYDKFLHWMESNGAVFPHLTLQRYEKNYRGVHISTSGANAPKEPSAAVATKGKRAQCREEEKEDQQPLPADEEDVTPSPSQPQHISSTSLPLPSPPRTPADANLFCAEPQDSQDPDCGSPLSAASSPSSISGAMSSAALLALDPPHTEHPRDDSPSPSPATPSLEHSCDREHEQGPSSPPSPCPDADAFPASPPIAPGSGPSIAKGTILLSIPHHLLITVELARASPLGALIAPLPNLGSQAILSVYLLQEMFKQRMWKRQQAVRAERARAETREAMERERRERERKVAAAAAAAAALVEREEEEECKSICSTPPAPAPVPAALPSTAAAAAAVAAASASDPPLSPSFWSPWLEVLPSSFSTLPLFFSAGESRALEGCAELLSKIAAQRRSMKEEFVVIKGVMLREYVRHVLAVRAWEAANVSPSSSAAGSSSSPSSKPPPPSPLIPLFVDFLRGFSYASFVWGCLAVGTRVFSLQIHHAKTSVLAPLADMMNHRTPSGTNWTYDSRRSSFTLTSCATLGDGEAVYESYGIKDNKRFFASYGFCLEENQANEVTLMVRGENGYANGGGGGGEEHDDPESAAVVSPAAAAPVRTFVLHGCWDHLSEDVLNFLRIANVYEMQMEQEQQAQEAAAAAVQAQMEAEAEAEAQAQAAAAAADQEEADLQQEEDELILAEGHAARRAATAGSTDPAPVELSAEETAALSRIEARRLLRASGGAPAAAAQAPITEQEFQSMLAQRLYARQMQQHQSQYASAAAARRAQAPPPVMLRSPPSPFATSGPISLDNELSALYTLRQSCRQTLLHYPTTLLEDSQLLSGLAALDARSAATGGLPAALGNLRNILVFRMGEKKVLHYWIDLATLGIALLCAPWDAPTPGAEGAGSTEAAHRRRMQQRALDLSSGSNIAPLSPNASCKAKVRFLLQTGSVSGILAPFVDRSVQSRAAALSPAHAAREMERKLFAAVGITLPAVPVAEKPTAGPNSIAVGRYRPARKMRADHSEQKEGHCRPFTAPLAGTSSAALALDSESDAAEDEDDDDDDEFSCSLSCPPSLSLLLQDLASTHGPNRLPLDPSQGPPAQGAMSYISAVVVPLQQSRWRSMQKRRRKKMLALKIKQAQQQQQQQMRMQAAMHQRGVRLMRPSDATDAPGRYFDSQRSSLSSATQAPPHPRELKQPSSASHWRSQLAHLQAPEDHEPSQSDLATAHSGYGGEYEASSNLLRYHANPSADAAAELHEHSHSDLLDRTPRQLDDHEDAAGEAGDDDDGVYAEEHTHLDRLSRRRELAEMEAAARAHHASQQQEAHLLSHASHPRSIPYSEAELYSYYTRAHHDQEDDESCSGDEDDDDGGAEFLSDPEEDEDEEPVDDDDDDEDGSMMDSDLDLMHAHHELGAQDDGDDVEFEHDRSQSGATAAAEDTGAEESQVSRQRSRRIHQLNHLISDDSEPEGEEVPASAVAVAATARPVSAADSERRLRAELREMQLLQQQQLQKSRSRLHSASTSRRSRTDSATASRNPSRVGFVRPQSGGATLGASASVSALRAASSDSAAVDAAGQGDASAISSRSASRSASRAAFLASFYGSVQAAQRDRLLKSREGGSSGLTAGEVEREEDSIMRDDQDEDDDANPLDAEPHHEEEEEPDEPVAAAVEPRASEIVRPPTVAVPKPAAEPVTASVPSSSASASAAAATAHRPAPITVFHDASAAAIVTKPVVAPTAAVAAAVVAPTSASSLPRSLPITIPVSSYHRPVVSTASAAAPSAGQAATSAHPTTTRITIAAGQRKKVLSASTPRVSKQPPAVAAAAAVDAPLPAPVLPPPASSIVSPTARFSSPPSSPAIPPAVAARVQRPLSLTRSPRSAASAASPSQVAARSTAAASPLSPLTLSSPQHGSSYVPSPRSSGAQLTPSPPPSSVSSLALPLTPTRLLPSVCNAQGYAIVSPNGSPPRLLRVASASSATSSPSSAAAASAAQLRGSPTRLPQVLSSATALSAQLGYDRGSPPAATAASAAHATTFPSVPGASRTSPLPLGATAPIHSDNSSSPARSLALHVPRELKFDSPTRRSHGGAGSMHVHSYSAYQLPNGSYLNASSSTSSPAGSPLRGSYAPPTRPAAVDAHPSPRGAGAASAGPLHATPTTSPSRRRISLSQTHAPVRAGPAYMTAASASSSSSPPAASSGFTAPSTFVSASPPRKTQSPWSVPATLPASMHRPYGQSPLVASAVAASPSSLSLAAASASPPHSLSVSPSKRCYSLPLPPSPAAAESHEKQLSLASVVASAAM